jgi:hypothetical protein
MQNFRQTIISQYQNDPIVMALMQSFNDAIDPAPLIQNFFDKVWNVLTADDYGLDVWGRIVGVGRYVNMSGAKRFGFATGFYPFNSGAPWGGGLSSSNNYRIGKEAYRQLILVKARANISSCSIPALNKIITALFPGRGRCYVLDLGNMAMAYKFEFPLTDVEFAIVSQSGAIPKPAGVALQFIFPTGA